MSALPALATGIEDERLPLLLGFQPVADNTSRKTRFMERGRGIYLYDTDGREYLEATASFYVAALGYQHAELIDAIAAQYRDLPFFVSAMGRSCRVSLELAERLAARLPVKSARVLFASTGSEAVDFLVKLLYFQAVTRGTPGRRTLVARQDSYHGATLASASLTGGHHEEFGLPLPGFRHVTQPDYHGARAPGETPEAFVARLADELACLVEREPPESIAAFFAEPISFSAGFRVPPAGYFAAIRRVLDAQRIALVADEVITGFGRTGHWFGCEAIGFEPAHLVTAKAITGGYFPLSAIAIGPELYADLETGSARVGTLAHAATHAAHPVGAAAALKVMEIIERDGLVAHAARMGEQLARGLGRLADHPLVGDVLTLGLAGCLDFLRRDADDRPINADTAAGTCRAVYEALLEAGVIARCTGRQLVFAPPLIIRPDEIDEICQRAHRALDEVLAGTAR